MDLPPELAQAMQSLAEAQRLEINKIKKEELCYESIFTAACKGLMEALAKIDSVPVLRFLLTNWAADLSAMKVCLDNNLPLTKGKYEQYGILSTEKIFTEPPKNEEERILAELRKTVEDALKNIAKEK